MSCWKPAHFLCYKHPYSKILTQAAELGTRYLVQIKQKWYLCVRKQIDVWGFLLLLCICNPEVWSATLYSIYLFHNLLGSAVSMALLVSILFISFRSLNTVNQLVHKKWEVDNRFVYKKHHCISFLSYQLSKLFSETHSWQLSILLQWRLQRSLNICSLSAPEVQSQDFVLSFCLLSLSIKHY